MRSSGANISRLHSDMTVSSLAAVELRPRSISRRSTSLIIRRNDSYICESKKAKSCQRMGRSRMYLMTWRDSEIGHSSFWSRHIAIMRPTFRMAFSRAVEFLPARGE